MEIESVTALLDQMMAGQSPLEFIAYYKHQLKLVANSPHTGLMSIQVAVPNSPVILTGIWVQGIDPSIEANTGKIIPHKHDDDEEYIIVQSGSNYPGLSPDWVLFAGEDYTLYRVACGEVHGSGHEPAYGYWISVKVKINSPTLDP